jgi:hypothetical protein
VRYPTPKLGWAPLNLVGRRGITRARDKAKKVKLTSFAPIRKFDDRFARQNRCELPPEFPLASFYSRIVHHLCKFAVSIWLNKRYFKGEKKSMLTSGPNSHALTQILPKTSGSVDGAPKKVPTSVHFHFAYGFHTQTLA